MNKFMSSAAAVVGRLRTNEDGATAMSFALGLTVMLSAIGIGMDFTVASKAHKKAQNIADMAALNAAAYVRDNDNKKPDQDATDAFLDDVVYKATDVGYTFTGLIEDEVKLQVEYDMNARVARAKVWGSTQTTFTNLLGHKKMPFEANATSMFLTKRITAPASVFIVADNSGSMAWHDTARYDLDGNQINSSADTDGQARIMALEGSVKLFMDKLEDVAGPQGDDDDKVVRTGLVPYSGSILGTQVERDWGYLTDSEIEAMHPNLSTNSSPPMTRVKEWMDTETQIHKEMHTLNPLRYVIFLTDGQNTGGSDTWVASPGGGVWTGQYCEMQEAQSDVQVSCSSDDADERRKVWYESNSVHTQLTQVTYANGSRKYFYIWDANNARGEYKESEVSKKYFKDRRNGGHGYRVTSNACYADEIEETEVCNSYDAEDNYGNVDYDDVIRQDTDPALNADSSANTAMTEGKFVYDFDWETVKTCNALRDDGVRVFSIGFALDPGMYLSNRVTYGRVAFDQAYEPGGMTPDEASGAFQRASQLLQGCAYENSEDYFMLASNTEALEKAFEDIGQTISEDVVRLTQ